MYSKALRAGAPPPTSSNKPVSHSMWMSKIPGSKAMSTCQQYVSIYVKALNGLCSIPTIVEYSAAPHIMNTLSAIILRTPILGARRIASGVPRKPTADQASITTRSAYMLIYRILPPRRVRASNTPMTNANSAWIPSSLHCCSSTRPSGATIAGLWMV